jgi:hypothetical protein
VTDKANSSSTDEVGLEERQDVLALFDTFRALRELGVCDEKRDAFEASLAQLMKVFFVSAAETEFGNVARFLADATFNGQPFAELADQLTRSEIGHLTRLAELNCMLVSLAQKISQLPESAGYEQLLKKNGFDAISARGMAHLIVNSGKRQAKEHRLRRRVVRAIRDLAKPDADSASALRQAQFLIQTADESSIVDTICCEVGLRETDLLPLLRALVDGKPTEYQHLFEVLEKLGPALSTPRGPKTSAASAAHEFSLDNDLHVRLGCGAYTLSGIDGDFTDPLTQATRVDFNDADFDPRPAYRRLKRRKGNVAG